MSAVPRTNRPSGTAQATRQQLDELDALLQRMLDLPVSSAEPDSPEEELDYPASTRSIPPETTYQEPFERSPRPDPVAAEPSRPSDPPARTPNSPRRTYPASYMVVETSTPPELQDLPTQASPETPQLHPRTSESFDEAPRTSAPRGYQSVDPETLARATDDWIPLRSTWQPSAQTWKPLAETWEQSRGAGANPEPEPVIPPAPRVYTPPSSPTPTPIPEPPRAYVPPSDPTPIPPMAQPVIPPSARPPVAQPVYFPPSPHSMGQPVIPPPATGMPDDSSKNHVPLILRPAVWFNQAFDLCLYPLGPIGRWFRGPSGRAVLGNLGMLALVAAAVLAVVDGFGWTR